MKLPQLQNEFQVGICATAATLHIFVGLLVRALLCKDFVSDDYGG